jgi:hypothetical protein
MSLLVLLLSLILTLTPVFGFNVELFSGSDCMQPLSAFLESNQMVNAIHDWTNSSIIPDSVVVTDDPSPCVPRTFRNGTTSLDGFSDFVCLNPSSTKDGYFRVYEWWNATNCSLPNAGTRTMVYGGFPRAGSLPGTCARGNLATNWANNSYFPDGLRFFPISVKVSCPNVVPDVPNDAPSIIDSSRMIGITITTMTSLTVLSTIADILWN